MSSPSQYTYRPPKSALGAFLWRRQMWFEATFALSMLEPWEKILVVSIVLLLMTLVLTGLYQYMPHHLVVMQRRATYYLFGQDSGGAERSLWQWVGGSPLRQEL